MRSIKLCVLSFIYLLVLAKKGTVKSKRNVVFLSGSGMGLYLALALPIDLPQYEISMSFTYEANYELPSDATELVLNPYYTKIRKARSLTRANIYAYVEEQLENLGFSGKECLLKTICETQANPIFGHNGLLGDVIHILFTPSTTAREEDVANDYEEAELVGRHQNLTCGQSYGNCSIDLYDFFSIWN